MNLRLAALATAGALTLAGLGSARAADPGAGTLDADHQEVTWSGQVLVQTAGISGIGCPPAAPNPSCDFYALTIGELGGAGDPSGPGRGHGNAHGHEGNKHGADAVVAPDDVLIGISTDATGIAEFDLYLYDATGTLVAQSIDIGSNDRIPLRSPAPGTYTVAVQSPLSQDPTARYQGFARVTDLGGDPIEDPETPCGLESVEDEAVRSDPTGLNGLVGDPLVAVEGLDTADPLRLDVFVLLEGGMPQAEAEQIFERAARSYEPLGIELVVAGFEAVDFGTNDGIALIAAGKAHLGGRRPAGVDVVEVLTTRDVVQLGQSAIAGIADCIGGVAHPDRAFLVAEGRPVSDVWIGPAVFDVDAAAVVTAHEIGHLFGGQHQYGNCVEGIDGGEVRSDGTVEGTLCTLMFNAADFIGPRFGTVNGLVVRGSASRYARP